MSASEGNETLQPARVGAAGTWPVGGVVGAGRYRIVRFLAAGGMGEVYEAQDLVVGGAIALKTLRGELAASAEAVEGLRREIALARKVTHRNICRLHDVGEHEGRVFLTMELLDGTTLASVLKERGPLPVDELGRIAAQLVAGLGALHSAGIVHRDFKTSNAMVVDGRVVITDFGLARAVTPDHDAAVTIEASLRGTPAYMAPEQVEGRPVTPASDIYALGVVLFELATGVVPFREDTALATATARLHKAPPDPRSLRRDLPAQWRNTILRCLARDPAARARRDDVLVRRRRRSVWIGAVAACLLLAAGTVALVSHDREVIQAKFPHNTRLRPTDPRVIDLYRRAMARFEVDDHLGAQDLLQQAASIAPDEPIVLGRYAVVLNELGFSDRAATAIAQARSHASALPEEARLFLDAVDALVRGSNAEATVPLRRLVEVAPNEFEYIGLLFHSLMDQADARLANIDEAASLLNRLARFEGTGARAFYERCAANLEAARGNYESMLMHARTLAALAHKGHLRQLEGHGETWTGLAQLELGALDDAKHSFERAIVVYATLGDANGILHARKAIADIYENEGKFELKAAQYDQIIAVARPLGERRLLANVLVDGGTAFIVAGKLDRASDAFAEGVTLLRELGDQTDSLLFAMLMRGRVAATRGDLFEAQRRFEETYEQAGRTHVSSQQSLAAFNLAMLATELDDEAAYREWRALAGEPLPGEVPLTLDFRRGDVAAARRTWELLRTKDLAPLIRAMIEAHVALADAHDGKLQEARKRFESVRSLLSDGIFIAPALLDANFSAASGDVGRALEVLDRKSSDLRTAGAVWYRMYVDAEAVQIATKAHHPSSTSRREELIELARKHGFKRRVRELTTSN